MMPVPDRNQGKHRQGAGPRLQPALLAGIAALATSAPAEAQVAESQPEPRRSVAPKAMHAVAPALADYTDDVLFGDIWRRPDLSPRDRSIVTLSVLITTGKSAQLTGHLGRALATGVKPTEIAGIVTHLAFYTGWPNAVSSLEVIETVFTERKVDMATLSRPSTGRPVASSDTPPSRTEEELRSVTPKLVDLTDSVLFGDLWRRTDLAVRDRSLVTIAALAAMGDEEQLRDHIRRGLANGLTRAEIGEALTHLAFYAGWPRATAAAGAAKRVFADQAEPTASAVPLQLYPPAISPMPAPASNFTGSATVTSPFRAAGTAAGGATVTFKPGARTHWHSHPKGQLLIVTDGTGWVQAEGGAVREVKAGDVVWTAPGARHWHGATRTTGMTHVAVSETVDGRTVAWTGPVADKEYHGPTSGDAPRPVGAPQ